MTNRHQALITATFLLCLLLLAGCVTSVDEALPYTSLPEISIASPVQLVASPSHPTSYLSSDALPAGSKVQVIGADANMAWLLVLHGEMLGWIPAFFSATNIGTLTPAITFEPLDGKCTQYLGATFDVDEVWTSASRGDLYILGSIYRPQAGTRFSNAALSIQINGGGAAVDSDYLHTPLTRNSAVIFFAYSVRDAQRNSRIDFNANDLGRETVLFQSLFFRNTCTGSVEILPIGIAKAAVQHSKVAPAHQQITPEQPTTIPTPIRRESGIYQNSTPTPQTNTTNRAVRFLRPACGQSIIAQAEVALELRYGYWAANGLETLTNNMRYIQVDLVINGQYIPGIRQSPTPTIDDDALCNQDYPNSYWFSYTATMDSLPVGDHPVQVIYRVLQPVDDGYGPVLTKSFTQNYTIRVR